ncbi:hypothetical protein V1525DRAFT_412378 [Lipomyces kononenkoae]|uniref:Uncharacterized protein n=1 Tax=Lipomyces kononenkoae TaxID=34357 RepID=A0ACC3SSS1_LIPKO
MPKAKAGHSRSIFACLKCHKSMMKCDIMTQGIPCSRCRARGDTECQLFPSTRIYGRENTLPAKSSASWNVNSSRSPTVTAAHGSEERLSVRMEGLLRQILSVEPPPPCPGSRIEPVDETSSSSHDEGPKGPDPPPPISNAFSAGEFTGVPPSPSMLFSLPSRMRVMINKTDTGTPIDKDTLVFVGESSPLSFLVRHLEDSGHVAMSNISQRKVTRPASTLSPSTASSATFLPETVVSSLQSDVVEALITAYFHTVHPFCPVINRRWFADMYTGNDVPPLLLNAVCFAACFHCEQLVIFRAGYSSREDAKEAFYADAKRLFDEEKEDDILLILQTAVLLSFYGGKPRRVWNNRSWLAIAVTIAEDLGLHRSTSGLKMNQADKSHLRIIGWCIVFRDFMTSLNYGRPQKTCDSRSDFELLTLEEFDIDEDPANPIFGRRGIENCHFLVENAKLNMLMVKVFNARYSPHSDPQPNLNELYAELMEWRRNLPSCLDWSAHPSSLAAIYTCMVYNHMIIFIFRPRMADSEVVEMCSLEQAIQAASEIASLVWKLGVIGTIRIPQDMYSIIVTAMEILMNDVQRNNSVPSKLQLQICLMTMTHAKENWDHAAWIVKFLSVCLAIRWNLVSQKLLRSNISTNHAFLMIWNS